MAGRESSNSVLAENFRRLRNGRSLETIRDQMAAQGMPIGMGTLHRAALGQAGNRLASLEKIAAFFAVTVDQLLQPDLGADLDAWPFSRELQEKVATLSPQKLLSLEVAMWTHLDEEAPTDVQERLRRARANLEKLTETVTSNSERTPTAPKSIRKI